MAFATLNGAPVISAHLHFPRQGVWTFDAQVDAQDMDLSGTIYLSTTDGLLTLVGTALRGGQAYDSQTVFGAVGRNGMSLPVTPKAYRLATNQLIILDLLGAAGEALANDADQSVLTQQLTAWSVLQGSVGPALTRLLSASGAVWRTKPDGTVWLGSDLFQDLNRSDANISDFRPQQGDVACEFDSLDVYPGVSFLGMQIEQVEHTITQDRIFSRLISA